MTRHTRIRLKMMTIFVMLFWLSAQQAMSHECIPASNSAADIFVYNSCKSDLLTGVSGHGKADSQADGQAENTAKIEALEQENIYLKAQLKELKARLLQIIGQY
tara:strand:+ start:1187 stop:1498 length:312 start_codon:yes stop_codon:yes gene_type:complete